MNEAGSMHAGAFDMLAELEVMAEKFERETQVFLGSRNKERAEFLRRVQARLRELTTTDDEAATSATRELALYLRDHPHSRGHDVTKLAIGYLGSLELIGRQRQSIEELRSANELATLALEDQSTTRGRAHVVHCPAHPDNAGCICDFNDDGTPK